jgi:hypothetical protein
VGFASKRKKLIQCLDATHEFGFQPGLKHEKGQFGCPLLTDLLATLFRLFNFKTFTNILADCGCRPGPNTL